MKAVDISSYLFEDAESVVYSDLKPCKTCSVFYQSDDEFDGECELCEWIQTLASKSHFWHQFQNHLTTLNPEQAELVRRADSHLVCGDHILPCIPDITVGWRLDFSTERCRKMIDPNDCDVCAKWWNSMLEHTKFKYVPLQDDEDCVCCKP